MYIYVYKYKYIHIDINFMYTQFFCGSWLWGIPKSSPLCCIRRAKSQYIANDGEPNHLPMSRSAGIYPLVIFMLVNNGKQWDLMAV